MTAILPALKKTAVLSKVAFKPAIGLDHLVSSLIVGAVFNLGEEVTDRVLENAVAWPRSSNWWADLVHES